MVHNTKNTVTRTKSLCIKGIGNTKPIPFKDKRHIFVFKETS